MIMHGHPAGVVLSRSLAVFVLLWSASAFSADLSAGFFIEIENKKGGEIRVFSQNTQVREIIGKVLTPAHRFSRFDYTAARWAANNEVAASAVNAIHLKAFSDTNGKAHLISLLPHLVGDSSRASFLELGSIILTDIPPGTGIFGEKASPFVGDPISLWRENKKITIDSQTKFLGNEILRIAVAPRPTMPLAIRVQNKTGGIITAHYQNGKIIPIARVVKPVHGIGRFKGTELVKPGRIRANHRGVICVSTSRIGRMGGFQVIPIQHSFSPEMRGVRQGAPQWMVVASLNGSSKMVGKAPLFGGTLRPGDLVYYKRHGKKNWETFSALNGLSSNALENVEEFLFVRKGFRLKPAQARASLTNQPIKQELTKINSLLSSRQKERTHF